MTLRRLAATALLLAPAAAALAAGRPPYGGTVRVGASALPVSGAPAALLDSPLEAALAGLLARPACRLEPGGGAPVPALARALTRPTPSALRVELASPAHAQALARAWGALGADSPYRALLHAVRSVSQDGSALELVLAYPWPDLERALCHPALAPAPGEGTGPFTLRAALPGGPGGVRPAQLGAQPAYPEGRPYLDALELAQAEPRALGARLDARALDVALGTAEPPGSAPLLWATYLAFSPRRLPATFRAALEAAVDRADLTRLHVRGPAQPMPHLLPPALLEAPAPARPAPPPAERGRTVTLLYDSALDDQRKVAERIQFKLHERGWAVRLEPLGRAALRQRAARGDFELALHSVLLPPAPGPALALVLELAGRRDRLGVELAPLGALPDAEARARRVRERALALGRELPLIPLYAQGLGARTGARVGPLARDGFGLPVLEALWSAPEGTRP